MTNHNRKETCCPSCENEFLKQEVEVISTKVNHLDDLRHRTQSMAIALWTASVGVVYTGKVDPNFLFVASVIPIPFWFLDGTYHRYQEGFTLRRRVIEAFLANHWRKFILDLYKRRKKRPGRLLITRPSNIPVPDYHGNDLRQTRPAYDRLTNFHRNLFTIKMLIFYLPLVLVPKFIYVLLICKVLKIQQSP